ncbi:MAG TPA: exodeoxyribonuclease VII large subunit [Candidatus Limnocylindrales bacterium]
MGGDAVSGAVRGEPPDWALPAWDATDGRPAAAPRPRDGASAPPSAQSPSAPPPSTASPPAGTFGLRILQVSDVTRAVREAVRGDERLGEVWVEGEVGRVTVSSAGHAYFTLKDERSQLACVFFRDDRLASPFEPRPGFRVVAQGRIDVFEQQGVYQLYVAAVQPAGFGDLALRFEALKAKLAAEGLFDAARKRPLPDRPAVIGVATSPTGAVWHDIQQVLRRRWPLARVLFVPCQVQGDSAPSSIVGALGRLRRFVEERAAAGRADDAPAVVILARGGGSLEDLWPFNDERVVRAVVGMPVPVVCGVGHETDVTLADFAADVRAPTPSAAAELVTPDRAELGLALAALARRQSRLVEAALGATGREVAAERRALDRLRPDAQLAQARERAGLLLDRATRAMSRGLDEARRATDGSRGRLPDLVAAALAGARTRLDRGSDRLPGLALARLASASAALDASAAALAALGPEATLARGYAIVRRRADGGIVRETADAPPGTRLALRLARGDLAATTDAADAPHAAHQLDPPATERREPREPREPHEESR